MYTYLYIYMYVYMFLFALYYLDIISTYWIELVCMLYITSWSVLKLQRDIVNFMDLSHGCFCWVLKGKTNAAPYRTIYIYIPCLVYCQHLLAIRHVLYTHKFHRNTCCFWHRDPQNDNPTLKKRGKRGGLITLDRFCGPKGSFFHGI